MHRKRLVRGLFIVFVVVFGLYLTRNMLFSTFSCHNTPAQYEFEEIKSTLYEGSADSAGESELRKRCLQLARDNPRTKTEIGALYLVAGTWPQTNDAKYALRKLISVSEMASLDQLGNTFKTVHARHPQSLSPLSPIVVRRAIANLKHPFAATLLTEASLILASAHDVSHATEDFQRVANLIVEHCASSPQISNFCEVVGGKGNAPRWGLEFEPHMRRILDVNRDRFVRCSAKIALASIVLSGGRERQQEAKQLFEEFLTEFDGNTTYHADGIEQFYRVVTRRILDTMQTHGLGMIAPETVGVDLEGQPIALTEFRGKIVLVSFWATWCYPCMKAIPFEKELYERLSPDQFTIVGVNADKEIWVAQDAVASYGIPWRSFQVKRKDGTSIADDWHIAGYPSLYLLDANGIIMGSWLDIPPRRDLERAIRELIAGHKDQDYSVRGIDNSDTESDVDHQSAAAIPIKVEGDLPSARGFVGRNLRRADGRESKYVVFIPKDYDNSKKYPGILFLHGSGAQGADGETHLTALAKAIDRRKESFPFITVFPQASSGDWQPGSSNAELAITALDDVIHDYSVDADRVALTGVSMGGEGTWSLAAAYPDRWSAIVPLCGGGNPATVDHFKHIPCWCFQGDADEITEPALSRKMVRALRIMGGQPIYVEYANVGHNCWDLAYARVDLFEWLMKQRRKH